ncbi:3-hydroxylacyl-ACP dehydratase [Rhodocyclus tenuis]|uniref:Putative hotdog family 3-hydroxylacyl-ACP dehydratase n=1 Tax=Rhodocyclus tenuis TaxID=1066 RepID=A0A840G468_RHOTE|nr:3-hydroxylacyl-ACP dehydratase [Rhodocyclus tenuis]MBB4245810.1 putative hotdog family 3-hydroxylacyl-ACP dehydratase [Rhodocyclus tenuis]
MIDRAWIAARIPHAGDMCLLDAVDQWSADAIVCRASSHRLPNNPLRAGGQLGITAGIEYAAQAMAVHGALLAGSDTAPAAGYLVSVRDVHWQHPRLDDRAGDLEVSAERLSGNGTNVLYRFSLCADDEVLLSGRAGVILDASQS